MPIWLYITMVFGVRSVVDLTLATVIARLVGRLFRLDRAGWGRSLALGVAVTALVTVARFCLNWWTSGTVAIATSGVLLLAAAAASPLPLRAFLGRSVWKGGFLAGPAFAALCFASLAIVAVAAYFTIATPLNTVTQSMSPTVVPGDRVLLDRTLRPRRWDIVGFYPPHEPREIYIKRLIGLPGETVEIVNGMVTIDGRAVEPPAELVGFRYDTTRRGTPPTCRGAQGAPMKLGPDECYVLADNTREGLDSRYFPQGADRGVQAGAVPMRSLVGVVRATYAPPQRMQVFR